MNTHKQVILSDCCNYKVHYCPSSLYEEGFYVCGKCNYTTFVHSENVAIMEKIGQGHYRKVDNKDKGL